jgi:sulfate adenylyltransferase subunit 1 (EFTu-like GTPase family)
VNTLVHVFSLLGGKGREQSVGRETLDSFYRQYYCTKKLFVFVDTPKHHPQVSCHLPMVKAS